MQPIITAGKNIHRYWCALGIEWLFAVLAIAPAPPDRCFCVFDGRLLGYLQTSPDWTCSPLDQLAAQHFHGAGAQSWRHTRWHTPSMQITILPRTSFLEKFPTFPLDASVDRIADVDIDKFAPVADVAGMFQHGFNEVAHNALAHKTTDQADIAKRLDLVLGKDKGNSWLT